MHGVWIRRRCIRTWQCRVWRIGRHDILICNSDITLMILDWRTPDVQGRRIEGCFAILDGFIPDYQVVGRQDAMMFGSSGDDAVVIVVWTGR